MNSSMKYSEIKALSSEEQEENLREEQENLRRLRFAHAISPIENPMEIKHSRKLIAKLQTALTESKSITEPQCLETVEKEG